MNNEREGMVRDYEIPEQISALQDWFGGSVVEARVQRHERAIASSNPIYADNYLRYRHPFWEGSRLFNQLQRIQGLEPQMLLEVPHSLLRLAADARNLSTSMPIKVREKFRRDLSDDERE